MSMDEERRWTLYRHLIGDADSTVPEPEPANRATGASTGLVESGPTQGAAEGLRALQRRNADRLGRLGHQGVNVPPYVLVDIKLEALKVRLGLSTDVELGTIAEGLMSGILDQIESQVSKAKLTAGVNPNLKLR